MERAEQPQLIEGLSRKAAYPHATDTIDLVETHISWVFLTGDFAYKVKKPVRFPFLDFTTLASRRRFCEDELRLNRRFAPEVYLDVVPIGGSPAEPRVGVEPAFEYAVKMMQFPRGASLADAIVRSDVPAEAISEFAERLVEFHRSLDSCRRQSTKDPVAENIIQLEASADDVLLGRLGPIDTWIRSCSAECAGLLRQRVAESALKDCHGDLHLGNTVWLGERIVPFDCLEFDADLRCLDAIDEVAFFVMDLMAHQRVDLAFGFLNRYLEVSGDYAGARLLRYFLVHRALVRAKVRQLSGAYTAETASTPYLDLAENLCAPSDPVLFMTHGLSGSGKTTATNGLIAKLPAIRIRSDVERKRLHGLKPAERSRSDIAQGIYAAAATEATYRHLAEAAASVLAAGFNVIVDAAFLNRPQREIFSRLAERMSVRLVVLSFSAGTEELRRRIRRRSQAHGDASEADVSVLDYQLANRDPLAADEKGVRVEIDTSEVTGTDELLQRIQSALSADTPGA